MKKLKIARTTSLILMLTLLGSAAITSISNASKLKMRVIDSYERAFYELIENTENIDSLLEKAYLSVDGYQLLSLSGDIEKSSAFAIADIGQMNVNNDMLFNMNKFLNQVGDYVKMLGENHSDGSLLKEAERNNILMLSGYAKKLKGELYKIRDGVGSEEITFDKALQKADSDLGKEFYAIETEKFNDFDAMTYSGPFSEHINTLTSYMLKAEPEVTKEEALKIAMRALGDKVLTDSGDRGGEIPAFSFSGEGVSVLVTKNGGHILEFDKNRAFLDPAISISDAINRAKTYLSGLGYENLKEVYYENEGATVRVNFAPIENGCLMYPDLVKADIALDNGEIMSIEADGYLMNHRNRRVNAIVTKEEVASLLPDGANIKNITLAFIPKEDMSEVLCYEIAAKLGDRTYLIYINAQNKKGEEILLLTEDETGRMTI